jgi:hypothetical protein
MQGGTVKRFFEHIAAVVLMAVILLGIAWLAGWPDWDDPFTYDHPENFARHIIGE